ncbi:MAG TPA: phosphatase PAP2 family protein [Candidatus Limnocylindrales bacterium]
MSEDAIARPVPPAASGETADAGATDATAAPVAPKAHEGLGARNDRLLLAAVAAYVVLLSGLMIARGISVTPDVVLVALGLAAVILGRGRLFLRDWIPFIGLFFAYELMRGYADKFGAAVHVTDVIAAERLVALGHLPTQLLQSALHPASGTDLLAAAGTVFYFLHFPLPLAVAFLLWLRRRRVYYDYVAALIVLSMAGFVTYILLPVAPPWWAAQHGALPADAILHLKDEGFQALATTFGFDGRYVYSYAIYQINPNEVAAFPSLHAAYPFLAFLFARRAFGRPGWLMLAYAACVWFSIVYLGEHWVVDILGGLAYAAAAYWLVLHAPGWFRRVVDRAADEELEAGVEAEDAGERGALGRLGRHVRWDVVLQGVVAFALGAALAAGLAGSGFAGGAGSPLYLLPWLAILGGAWRAAVGLLSR